MRHKDREDCGMRDVSDWSADIFSGGEDKADCTNFVPSVEFMEIASDSCPQSGASTTFWDYLYHT
jgi:hypothetical protein